jgi:hypothetical protein
MKQTALNPRQQRPTRKQQFLHQMDQVVPWSDLVSRISPFYPECHTERGPMQLQILLRTHLMQQWFELSDPAMEEAFYDTPVFREFAQSEFNIRLPDENMIMRFRYRLQKHKLDEQIRTQIMQKLEQEGFILTPGAVKDAQLTPTDSVPFGLESDVPPPVARSSQRLVETKPLPDNTPWFQWSEVDGILYIQLQPAPERGTLTLQAIQSSIEQHGYGDCDFNLAALQTVVEKSGHALSSFRTAVGIRLDAQCTVHIANDDMSAFISLTPARGGQAMTALDIVRNLRANKVSHGIDEKAIATILEAGSAEHVLVAKGQLPAHGNDTTFKVLIESANSELNALDLDGRIDYRAQNTISSVAAGTVLMRRIPPTAGTAGYTVTGRVIEAQAGKELPFAADLSGVQISESDPEMLVATIAGHPVVVERGMRVDPLIRLAEVNLSSGNIDFIGAVHIEGDVIQGMKIKATGDVFIGGVVERSSIETPGNIMVKGGVIGDAILQAGETIRARFSQGASITATKRIEIEEMALQSFLTAEHIDIGFKMPQRGRLVGGITRALYSLTVPYLGSDDSNLTRVIVGVHDEWGNQFRAMQFTIFEKQSIVEKLSKVLTQLMRAGDPKNQVPRAQAALQETQKNLAELELQSQQLDEQLNLLRQSKVIVGKETTGMVEVTVANYKVRLTQGYGRGHFGLSEQNRVVHVDPKGFAGLVL